MNEDLKKLILELDPDMLEKKDVVLDIRAFTNGDERVIIFCGDDSHE